MSELKRNQEIALKEALSNLNIQEKDVLRIYKGSLKNIRNELVSLNEKIKWSYVELDRYGRLKKLESQILEQIKLISNETYKTILKSERSIVVNTYRRNWFGAIKQTGVNIRLTDIDSELVRSIVEEPYPNITLKEMIRDVGVETIKNIKYELGQGLLQGESMAKIAKRLKDKLGISYNRAITISRTEGLTAHSQSQLEATKRLEEKGLKMQKVWDSTLDGRTRSTHRSADGQKADKKGDFTVGGVKFTAPLIVSKNNSSPNVKAERINCRCNYTTEIEGVPETYETRKRKEQMTIKGMSYKDWKQSRQKK